MKLTAGSSCDAHGGQPAEQDTRFTAMDVVRYTYLWFSLLRNIGPDISRDAVRAYMVNHGYPVRGEDLEEPSDGDLNLYLNEHRNLIQQYYRDVIGNRVFKYTMPMFGVLNYPDREQEIQQFPGGGDIGPCPYITEGSQPALDRFEKVFQYLNRPYTTSSVEVHDAAMALYMDIKRRRAEMNDITVGPDATPGYSTGGSEMFQQLVHAVNAYSHTLEQFSRTEVTDWKFIQTAVRTISYLGCAMTLCLRGVYITPVDFGEHLTSPTAFFRADGESDRGREVEGLYIAPEHKSYADLGSAAMIGGLQPDVVPLMCRSRNYVCPGGWPQDRISDTSRFYVYQNMLDTVAFLRCQLSQ